MSFLRNALGLFAVVAVLVATRLSESGFADGLRDAGLGYMAVDLLLRMLAGYRRRRPYWTPQSWRRYFAAASIPAGALVIGAAMLAAIEWRLPGTGEARSAARTLWALGVVFFFGAGAVGVSVALGWLSSGEASTQFALPRWLASRRSHAA